MLSVTIDNRSLTSLFIIPHCKFVNSNDTFIGQYTTHYFTNDNRDYVYNNLNNLTLGSPK